MRLIFVLLVALFIGLVLTSLFLDALSPEKEAGQTPASFSGPTAQPPVYSSSTATPAPAPFPQPPSFRGPSGEPHVIGPSAPPPDY